MKIYLTIFLAVKASCSLSMSYENYNRNQSEIET